MTLANKLVQLRKEKGFTQQQLGDMLNITAQAISKWENGLAEPDLSMLKNLANIYNVSIAELLDENETAKENAVKHINFQEQLIGTCTVCGIAVTENNVGTKSPRVLCASCFAKTKAEETAKRKEEEELARKADEKMKNDHAAAIQKAKDKRKRGLVVGCLAATIALVIMLIVTITQWNNIDGTFRTLACIGCVVVPYLTLALVACMFCDGPALYVVMWGFVHSIKWPGIIFSFDLGGFVFFIVVKLLFAVLSFLIGILTSMIGIVVGAVIAAIQFPITYGKKIENTIKE